uniref:Uncharacterized protein n=1 Tax=Tetraselmis sp. GSL018 TaxID=582737 RepID=A0A061SDJ9_9CHLO
MNLCLSKSLNATLPRKSSGNPARLPASQMLGYPIVQRGFKFSSCELGGLFRLKVCSAQTAVLGSASSPRRCVTKMGLPIPVIGFLFTPFTVALLYFAAAVRFWAGYKATSFSNTLQTKVMLTALWPVLVVTSPKFRENFKKALTDP